MAAKTIKSLNEGKKSSLKSIPKPAGKSSKTNSLTPDNPGAVDEWLKQCNHPLKQEIDLVRNIIKSADHKIKEQVKWSAPSFFYKEDLVTFNHRMQDAVHLIFHHPDITKIKSPLLEGDYKDRRMMYLRNVNEVTLHQKTLQAIIQQLVTMIDKRTNGNK